MQKFWTVKDGKVGTAHRNREGKVVDFRPASRITGDEKTITIYPPKGQINGVEPLKLETTRIERVIKDVDLFQKGIHKVEEVGFILFEGVEVSAVLRSYTEWYDKEAETANTVERQEQMARVQKRRDEERDFLKNISFGNLAVEVTTSELGKLRSGKLSVHFLLENLLRRIMIATRATPDFSLLYFEVKEREEKAGYLDQLKADFLAFDDRRKKERKQQWLAKA